jgi:4,5-DOPA dioxygenase extradiol
MPGLFVGHGNPMNALTQNAWTAAWTELGRRLPRPRAILAVSAHWYLPGTHVTAMESPRTIHDFGGFPAELYAVRYHAPGDPALARRARDLLGEGEAPIEAALDGSWGLDHGTWSVLAHMYPEADVPVVQLSLDETQPPAFFLDLGRRLRALRDEGVLVIGSGFMTHGLPFITREMLQGATPGWSADFDAWAWEAVQGADLDTLAAFRQLAPGMPYAHPTVEHFTPLFVTLGAATDLGSARTVIGGSMMGLSRRSLELV